MLPAPAKKPATYEDLTQLTDRVVGEILDGELFATPRPAARHAHLAIRLSASLGGPFDEGRDGPGGWVILFEPELHLHDEIVVPDLAGWRRERLPTVPDEPFLTLAPDWVCEILSPPTERVDRLHKLPIYAREGASHAWIVNPTLRLLEVLRREGHRWAIIATLGREAEPVSVEPFEVVPLELSRLWGD